MIIFYAILVLKMTSIDHCLYHLDKWTFHRLQNDRGYSNGISDGQLGLHCTISAVSDERRTIMGVIALSQ